MYNNITYNQGEDENDVTLIIEKLENLIVGQTDVIMSDMCLITEIREMMRTWIVTLLNYAVYPKHVSSASVSEVAS